MHHTEGVVAASQTLGSGRGPWQLRKSIILQSPVVKGAIPSRPAEETAAAKAGGEAAVTLATGADGYWGNVLGRLIMREGLMRAVMAGRAA